MLKQQLEADSETRYDAKSIQEVVALASKLEQEYHETVTADQAEQIAVEAGVDPAFVRKAFDELTARKAATQEQAETLELKGTGILRSKAEFLAWLAAFNIPVLHSIFAYFFGRPTPSYAVTTGELFAFIVLPLMLSWVPGFLTGRKKAGVLFGFWYATCLMVTVFLIYPGSSGGNVFSWPNMVSWLQYAVPGAALGAAGAWLRARIAPPSWLKGRKPS